MTPPPGRHRSLRWLWVLLLLLGVASIVLAYRHRPPSPPTTAALQRTIVDYRRAFGASRPPGLAGKPLTLGAVRQLQATFAARLASVATEAVLAREGRSYDYAQWLLEQERELGAESVGWKGRIVYWDFCQRDFDGSVVVRAAVATTLESAKWDSARRRYVEYTTTAYPSATVNQYTLKKVNGEWKVADCRSWRFYDLETGSLGSGP